MGRGGAGGGVRVEEGQEEGQEEGTGGAVGGVINSIPNSTDVYQEWILNTL